MTYRADRWTALGDDGVGALRAYLDQFWNRALAAFKAAVEQGEEMLR
jgi:hypothetical protein